MTKNAIALATSETHSGLFSHFNEEIMFSMLDTMSPTCDQVRSDLVSFETAAGEECFVLGALIEYER